MPVHVVGPGMRSVCFSWCYVGAICSVFISVWGRCLRLWLGHRHVLGVRPSIRSVPCSFITSMYQAYRIRHFNATLFAPFIGCFSPYLPVLAIGGHSHYSVLSFPNQNLCLGSISGEMAELDGRESIINTPPLLLGHSECNS